MKRIVGVRFKKAGRMYYFNPGELEIRLNDGVIVETARGMEYGETVLAPRELPDEQIIAPLKDVVRVATEEDRDTHERNTQLEEEAFTICQQKIHEHKLDMKLVNVEYTFNGSKITFFFTSEGRVDFRELVKDLAFVFKTRIELRQIGVRDEAKMLGGLGSCGRPVCCNTFLADFQPVSIKMAKEQKLSLSPTKISGLCGRLMCCLKYEQDAYESMRKMMPKVNREVLTADGKGMVLDNNAITEKTKVRITLPDGTPDVREYHFSEVRKPGSPEEEEAQMRELAREARERAMTAKSQEEEFRFVTGALPEQRPAEQKEEAQTREESPKRSNRRRRGSSGGKAGGDQPRDKQQDDRQSNRPDNRPDNRAGNRQGSRSDNRQGNRQDDRSGGQRREQGGGQQKQEQKKPQPNRQEQGQQSQGEQKPHKTRRGGRKRRKKPTGNPAGGNPAGGNPAGGNSAGGAPAGNREN